MPTFKNLLERFGEHEENLKELGDEIVKRYPQSKRLVELSKELSAAVDALDELKNKLEEAITMAEQETALKADLFDQVKASEVYSVLSDKDQDKLIEYLITNKAGLASAEELLKFVQDAYAQKDDAGLIAEFPKAHILELGKSLLPEADEFEAYQAGLKSLQGELSAPESRAEIVNDLASVQMKEAPEQVIRSFYSKAFQAEPVKL